MVKAKVISKLLLVGAVSILSATACRSSYTVSSSFGKAPYQWKDISVDASRTGVKPTNATNAKQALGYVDEEKNYYAPSGKVFEAQSSTAQLAEILIDAQPGLLHLKQVVAYAPKAMDVDYPQSELTNFAVDCIMAKVESLTGLKVDVGITNFGGVRCNIPQGDVALDDVVSMFPFKNYLVYIQVDGKRLKQIIERMASRKVEILGGVELVVENKKIKSLTVGGKPIEEDKLYGIASIDFLLKGGDKLNLEVDAKQIIHTDVLIRECFLEKVLELSAKGLPLEYHLDNRVRVINSK